MIYRIHFEYGKIASRKGMRKFEATVFALNEDHAQEQVMKLVSNYPIKVENLSITGGALNRTLEEIYEERPILRGISPEQGYIYNEFEFRDRFAKYFK